MDPIADVFAGEEEITPRINSPVTLPTVPISVNPPTRPENEINPSGGNSGGTGEPPKLDAIPWCDVTHNGPRRSARKKNAPLTYYPATPRALSRTPKSTRKAATSVKKMNSTRKVAMKQSPKTPVSGRKRMNAPRRLFGSSPQRHSRSMSAPGHALAHSTPRPTKRNMNRSMGHKSAGAGNATGRGKIKLPKQFMVTIEPVVHHHPNH